MQSLLLKARRSANHLVLATAMSLIALTAGAQSVSSSFIAEPTSFAAGSTVDFRWQLFGTESAAPYSILSMQLIVDFGDGTSTGAFIGPAFDLGFGLLTARSFEHTYSSAGIYTAVASWVGSIITTVQVFDPEGGGFVGLPIRGTYSGNQTVELTSVAAIPEPETYAMLLAGLGLLGFEARRRKKLERAVA
jgi:hypothetical protein